MRYRANAVEVEAHRIIRIRDTGEGLLLTLADGAVRFASPEMTSRMTPVKGDYWVTQDDGYHYLNPKDVFERKYSAL